MVTMEEILESVIKELKNLKKAIKQSEINKDRAIKKLEKEKGKVEARNKELQEVLDFLLDITQTDNYGNLKKKIEAIMKNEEDISKAWWYNEPTIWFSECKTNADRNSVKDEVRSLTQKCLEKFEIGDREDEIQLLIKVMRTYMGKEKPLDDYKWFCSEVINYYVPNENLKRILEKLKEEEPQVSKESKKESNLAEIFTSEEWESTSNSLSIIRALKALENQGIKDKGELTKSQISELREML